MQYITKLGQVIYHGQWKFSELVFNLKIDWSLDAGLFCFSESCPLKEIGFERKHEVNFFKALQAKVKGLKGLAFGVHLHLV